MSGERRHAEGYGQEGAVVSKTGMLSHYMLKKGSDRRHFAMLLAHGARGDIGNAQGVTAIDLLARKKDPAFRRMAEKLATGPTRR